MQDRIPPAWFHLTRDVLLGLRCEPSPGFSSAVCCDRLGSGGNVKSMDQPRADALFLPTELSKHHPTQPNSVGYYCAPNPYVSRLYAESPARMRHHQIRLGHAYTQEVAGSIPTAPTAQTPSHKSLGVCYFLTVSGGMSAFLSP